MSWDNAYYQFYKNAPSLFFFFKLRILIFQCPGTTHITNFTRMPHLHISSDLLKTKQLRFWYQTLQMSNPTNSTSNQTNSSKLTTATTMFGDNGHRFSDLKWSHHGFIPHSIPSISIIRGVPKQGGLRTIQGAALKIDKWIVFMRLLPYAMPPVPLYSNGFVDLDKATRQPSMY